MAAAHSQDAVTPISPLPAPPVPRGRSRRVLRRYARAMTLWESAEAARLAINDLCAPQGYAEPLEGGWTAPPARRIRRREASSPLEGIWLHLLAGCGRVIDARRQSLSVAATGAEVRQCLTRLATEDYTVRGAHDKYVPFVAAEVAEPPEGSRAIRLQDALPATVAARYLDMGSMLRPNAAEILAEVNPRYRSVLGERRQWVE